MTDQQLDIDAIEAVIRNAAQLGADIAPETAAAMAAEIRRLRAELTTARAAVLREIATLQDQTATTDVIRKRRSIAAARRLVAVELRFMAEDAAASAVEAHVVADDSDDPETSYEKGLCTFGEGDAPGSGCILPAGHQPASRHIVTAGDADIDD